MVRWLQASLDPSRTLGLKSFNAEQVTIIPDQDQKRFQSASEVLAQRP